MPVHHITLSVTNPDVSSRWYQALLGPAEAFPAEGEGWRRVVLAWPDGLMIGLRVDAATPSGDRFHHARVGLDHVSLACADEAEVRSLAARMDGQGIEHGPVEEAPYGWAVTARDPDGIPVEFFAPMG